MNAIDRKRFAGLLFLGFACMLGSFGSPSLWADPVSAPEFLSPDSPVETARIGETDEIQLYRLGSLQRERQAVVLLDPILFDPGILLRDNGLVEELLDEDYNVYLMMWKDPTRELEPGAIGVELEKAISLARTDCECKEFIAGGLSMGGQRWLPYLGRLGHDGIANEDSRANQLHSIFFLGTGLDYSYPHSLYRQNAFPINVDLSQNCANLSGPCLDFIPTVHFKRGLKLRRIPAPLVPPDLGALRMFPEILEIQVPVAFVFGKVDGFSPEESIYPVYRAWAQKTVLWQIRQKYAPYSTDNPVFWLEGSGANRIHDYDQFDLFLHPDADDELYGELVDWMQDAERQP
ncbi:MAG: hypothetical protein KDK25_05355 [Leptospiraceae bacterium]|nr:hypothetical protein [Leptospiraceae bacterium]